MRLKIRNRILLSALCAVTALGVGAAAYSQPAGQTWNSSQLPATNGTVRQYTLTPRGDVDGLILTDGTEVKVPPHLTGQIVYSIHPGDAVMIRGLRARALPLVQAEWIRTAANARTVVDNGPPGPAGGGPETTLSSRVLATLHGARGEVNGALLDNGVVLRLPPPEADRMQSLLQPGTSSPSAGRGSIPHSAASSTSAQSGTRPIGSVSYRMHRGHLLAEARGPADRMPYRRCPRRDLLHRLHPRRRAADAPSIPLRYG